jgi:hypothetical protein
VGNCFSRGDDQRVAFGDKLKKEDSGIHLIGLEDRIHSRGPRIAANESLIFSSKRKVLASCVSTDEMNRELGLTDLLAIGTVRSLEVCDPLIIIARKHDSIWREEAERANDTGLRGPGTCSEKRGSAGKAKIKNS